MSGEGESQLVEARRRGDPFLVYEDGGGRRQVLSLPGTWDRVTIGRGMSADLALTWDSEVSRMHAELLRMGDDWAVIDDGLSRNGTFVNDERVEQRRRLLDGDELRVGETALRFHAPFQAGDSTAIANPRPAS